MAAIFEIGGHIEITWTQRLFASSNSLSTCWDISHITLKSYLNRLLPFSGKIVTHANRGRQSWKLEAILKWSKLLNRSYNINCAFYMLKTHIFLIKLTFLTICSHFMAKIGFQDSPWWPSWKMATILKFCVDRVIFLQVNPYCVCVPNLLVVS